MYALFFRMPPKRDHPDKGSPESNPKPKKKKLSVKQQLAKSAKASLASYKQAVNDYSYTYGCKKHDHLGPRPKGKQPICWCDSCFDRAEKDWHDKNGCDTLEPRISLDVDARKNIDIWLNDDKATLKEVLSKVYPILKYLGDFAEGTYDYFSLIAHDICQYFALYFMKKTYQNEAVVEELSGLMPLIFKEPILGNYTAEVFVEIIKGWVTIEKIFNDETGEVQAKFEPRFAEEFRYKLMMDHNDQQRAEVLMKKQGNLKCLLKAHLKAGRYDQAYEDCIKDQTVTDGNDLAKFLRGNQRKDGVGFYQTFDAYLKFKFRESHDERVNYRWDEDSDRETK